LTQPIIIGGGITGAFIAFFLAKRGIRCTLISNDEAHMASHTNPGGINPLHGPGIPGAMEGFSMQAYHLHLMHWDEISTLSGIDFSACIIERILLAFTEDEKQQLLDNQKLYQQQVEFSAHWLSADELISKEPRLSPNILGGLYTRGNATVDAALYTQAVLLAAQALGANVIFDTVASINKTSGYYHLHCSSEQTYSTAQLIIAAGAHTKTLLEPLGVQVAVKPIKGELLLVEVKDTPFAVDITRGKDGLYQYRDNLYWLGGTREDIGFDFSISNDSCKKIIANVTNLLPSITNATVKKHLVAMRPSTPDGLPIVGSIQHHENLFVATGAGSKGMLWSTAMADTIIKLLHKEAPDEHYAFLSADRFTTPH
jgi:glycine oxidase